MIVTEDFLHRSTKVEPNSVRFVVSSHSGAELFAQGSDEGLGVESHHVNLGSELAGRCGDFAPDEPGSQNHQVGVGTESIAKVSGIVGVT